MSIKILTVGDIHAADSADHGLAKNFQEQFVQNVAGVVGSADALVCTGDLAVRGVGIQKGLDILAKIGAKLSVLPSFTHCCPRTAGLEVLGPGKQGLLEG